MTEDRSDELLRRLARDYNAPPETPREELWAAISAARGGPRTGPHPIRVRPWLRRLGGLAAMLLLGFAVGRLATRDGRVPQGDGLRDPSLEGAARERPAAPAAPLAEGAGRAELAATQAPGPAQGRDVDPRGETLELRDGPRLVSAIEPRRTRTSRLDRSATRTGDPGGERDPWLAPDDPPAPGAVYALVATQTLAQGEALLTAFRVAGDPDEVDPQVGEWAREILFTTRLLLDSPAVAEPLLRGLLEDLELVLLQIALLSGGPADSAERAWIHETLRQRDMLPRLRSVVPAGPAAGT